MKFSILAASFALLPLIQHAAIAASPAPLVIASNWQLQDSAKVSETDRALSLPGFRAVKWYRATVPGTVLTSLVNDKVYHEPLYGENNRPNKIPDSLCRTSYWYRTQFTVPELYTGKRVWLNFDGINYSAEVWVNGKDFGTIKGAFSRGVFDISSVVTPGKLAGLAVLVNPQPHPGKPHEHTLANGMGGNGGQTAIDGPTFLCSIGWDWIPAIRDRDTGIWQKVFLTASGAVPSTGRYSMLRNIPQPALIVHGNKDIVVAPVNALILAEQMPNAQLIVYPDSSHGAQDQHADRFLKHAGLFLAEQS